MKTQGDFKMKNLLIVMMTVFCAVSHAATTTTKQIDTIQNSTGGTALAVPSVGAAIISDSATQTLSNKTLSAPVLSGSVSGTYTLGGTPSLAASALTGTLGVANGGTGAASLTSGSVVVGNGTSAVSLVAPSTTGNVLTSNGSTWISSPASTGGGSANLVGSVASPQSVVAATAVAVTGQIVNGPNVVFVSGSSGSVTVTATPSITACTAAGEQLQLVGGANNVVLQDNSGLAGSKLKLNGTLTLGTTSPASYTASFVCDAASGNWVELARY